MEEFKGLIHNRQLELENIFQHIIKLIPSVNHIERFNRLVYDWIPSVLPYSGNIDTIILRKGKRYQFRFLISDYEAVRQNILPDEAQRRNLNYTFDIFVKIRLEVYKIHDESKSKSKSQHNDKNQTMKKKRGRKSTHTRHDQLEKSLLCEPRSERVLLCSLPTMLNSDVCILRNGGANTSKLHEDIGGSFITRGKRKFIPLTDRMQYNRPYFFFDKKSGSHYAEIRSEHMDRKLRSTSTLKIGFDPKTQTILVNIPYVNKNQPCVPLRVMLLALGMSWDTFLNIVEHITPSNVWNHELVHRCRQRMDLGHRDLTSMFDAGQFMCSFDTKRNSKMKSTQTENDQLKNNTHIQNTLDSEVLPHMNIITDERKQSYLRKAMYITWCVSMLWRYTIGDIPGTDKDSYENKTIDSAAESIGMLFRRLLIDFQKNTDQQLRRWLSKQSNDDAMKRICITKFYKADRLSPKVMQAVSSGRWSAKKRGMSQTLRCINEHLIEAQLRLIKSPLMSKKGTHMSAREIHSSGFGFICPASSPEGKHVGLARSIASTALLSPELSADVIDEYLIQYILSDIFVPFNIQDEKSLTTIVDCFDPNNHVMLFGPNGVFKGWLTQPNEAIRRVRQARRQCDIDSSISIYWDHKVTQAIHIKSSCGRLMRPLLVRENLHKMWDIWNTYKDKIGLVNILEKFIQHGTIEYIDTSEQTVLRKQTSIISHLDDFYRLSSEQQQAITHIELSDIASIGRCTAKLSFFRHNQGPRTVYGESMLKQAVSGDAPDDRGNVMNRRTVYAQRRIVHTSLLDGTDFADGINCVVAICPHQSNQEDAIIIKKQAIDRGLFLSTSTRTYAADFTPRGNSQKQQDIFCKPDPSVTDFMKQADYSKLQNDGLPKLGERLNPGDVIIGRVVPDRHQKQRHGSNNVKMPTIIEEQAIITNADNPQQPDCRYKDSSILVRNDECGQVTDVSITERGRKIRLTTMNTLEQGDKLSDGHGQKGVVGCIMDETDMPFTGSGIVPDVLINPCGFPSRMTMGKILEMLMGKASAISGKWKDIGLDRQYFDANATDEQVRKAQAILKSSEFGTETLYDGRTGKMYGHRDRKTGQIVPTPIFIGITYIWKMDHMVSRKYHARARGPVNPTTRQPTRGRRKDGGLRLGYMEIDAIAAHGAADLLKSETTTASDVVTMYLCNKCGNKAEGNLRLRLYMCRVCNTGKYIRKVKQSYSANVMFTYLEAGGIKVNMKLRDKTKERFDTDTDTDLKFTQQGANQHPNIETNSIFST